MARTVEDVLGRRTRALFLNADAAAAMASVVASLLARELGKDQAWADTQVERFIALAAQYRLEKTVTETAA
jgi:glycerol-3-phosphate dehydrogenase